MSNIWQLLKNWTVYTRTTACENSFNCLHFGTQICIFGRSFKTLLPFQLVYWTLLVVERIFTDNYRYCATTVFSPPVAVIVFKPYTASRPLILATAIRLFPSANTSTPFLCIFPAPGERKAESRAVDYDHQTLRWSKELGNSSSLFLSYNPTILVGTEKDCERYESG